MARDACTSEKWFSFCGRLATLLAQTPWWQQALFSLPPRPGWEFYLKSLQLSPVKPICSFWTQAPEKIQLEELRFSGRKLNNLPHPAGAYRQSGPDVSILWVNSWASKLLRIQWSRGPSNYGPRVARPVWSLQAGNPVIIAGFLLQR